MYDEVNIYFHDLAIGETVRVTNDPGQEHFPEIKGDRIVYLSNSAGFNELKMVEFIARPPHYPEKDRAEELYNSGQCEILFGETFIRLDEWVNTKTRLIEPVSTTGESILYIRNGDIIGDHRTNQTSIWINDIEIISGILFNEEFDSIAIFIDFPNQYNEFEIEVGGPPGSYITVLILNFPSSYNLSPFIIDDDISNGAGDYTWAEAVIEPWCTGSGSLSDPYIIKDIRLNAQNSGSGIEIRNSDVYFRIENCLVYNSGSNQYDAGIKLYNVKNGKLVNNNCSENNYYGICLMHCIDILISGNFVQDNYANGIYLYQSSSNQIKENIASGNVHGFVLFGGSNNSLTDNKATENSYGFGIYSSFSNTLGNNNATKNIFYGIFLTSSANNKIIGNIASENLYGFEILRYSYNNEFSGNLATYNTGCGFSIDSCAYNNFFSNQITFNLYGIKILSASSDNVFLDNNFTGNDVNAFDEGMNNQWDDGVKGNFWYDYLDVDFNDDGIGDSPYIISGFAGAQDNYPIWDDGENSPIGNNIELNDPISGISITFTTITQSGTTIVTSSDTGNDPPSSLSVSGLYYEITNTASYSGVITVAIPYTVGNPRLMHWNSENNQWEDITTLIDSSNKIIYGNISSFSEFVVMTGISPTLYIDSDFTFNGDIFGPIVITADNIVIDGNGYRLKGLGTRKAFELNGRKGVTIKNVVVERWTYGFYLEFANFNTYNNNIIKNCGYGFLFYGSSNNLLSNNLVAQSRYKGFYLRLGSNFNKLTNNIALENPEQGFSLIENSNHNFLSENMAINNGQGFSFIDSNYNSMLNNLADCNKYTGFPLSRSSYNILIGNIAMNANYGFNLGENSNNNVLAANTIKFNWGGIFIRFNSYTQEACWDNLIYHNNFIDNTDQARDTNAGNNLWYSPEFNEGNYWSNYIGQDADGDGIGDSRKYIWGGSVGLYAYDLYPFMQEITWITIDSDNDGIINVYEELIYGTDPLNANTDNDGILDGDEVYLFGTDPLNGVDYWTYEGNEVQVIDSNTGIILTFDEITDFGATSIITNNIGPDPPSGFLLTDTYYNISTTAFFLGTIEIAIQYDETLVKGNEKHLNLKHWDSESEIWTDVTTWVDTEANIIYGEVESFSIIALFEDITPPSITVVTPKKDQALQDGIMFTWTVEDTNDVIWLKFTIREDNGANGIFIHDDFENVPVEYNEVTNEWQLFFDTTILPDGLYLIITNTSDRFDNIGVDITSFSIRNWAVLELLPSTEDNKAGRTMPVKFSLKVHASVDLNTPFVRNEEINVLIYAFSDPNTILRNARFGTSSIDYRIDSLGELYITNFKTSKIPQTYVVEIWRKGMLIGSFTFKTVDKDQELPEINDQLGTNQVLDLKVIQNFSILCQYMF